MKSIMEEASSISKAVEKGWQKAGQPKEFSVKIFEEPQKNFLGITTKTAKIGVFFNETVNKTEPVKPKYTPTQKEFTPKETIKEPKGRRPLGGEIKKEEHEQQAVWTQAMITNVKDWLTQMLQLINASSTNFTIQVQHFSLRIQFDGPLLPNKDSERQLFACFATLVLQMLKYEYRRPLKGYKLIFIGC